MNGFREFLLEMAARKSANRLVGLAKKPDSFMAVISAKREGMSPEQVKRATAQLKKELEALKPLGFGVTPTTGGYQEGPVRSLEPSFVVSFDSTRHALPPDDELVSRFVGLADKYRQMAVLIKLPGQETHEYTTQHHDSSPNARIPYHEPAYDPEPTYFTRPRYRGTGKKSQASDRDGLAFSPDFGNIEPYSQNTP